jgi:hypothetical protein
LNKALVFFLNYFPEHEIEVNNIFNTMKIGFSNIIRQKIQDISFMPNKPGLARYLEALNNKNHGLVNRLRFSFVDAKLGIVRFINSLGIDAEFSAETFQNHNLYAHYVTYRATIMSLYEAFSEELMLLFREIEHFLALDKANSDWFGQY